MRKMRTLGQMRSEFALKKVLENQTLKTLKPFSAGAPSMILQNGFGQALAFWAAKGKYEHMALLTVIREWFNKNGNDFFKSNTLEEFMIKISESSQQDYFEAQQETMHLLEWVKRYANAFIKDIQKEEA
ncbi:type III-B CRISPR module-associated protein Cmr5 [Desulfobacula sp.]|jgi:CRISPR-associated protein Cmr5|uniref:type III-B CRISPR module-associated protein Cmr5 n=1 Tax=Desulfobacula sp. TaxID=2593537 RepID=UPI0039B95AF7